MSIYQWQTKEPTIEALILEKTTYPCGYLPGRIATMEAFLVRKLVDEELDFLLANGYRHFGQFFFRPVCEACRRCVPLRVPVKDFAFSRSARRLLNRNESLELRTSGPAPSLPAFELYKRHKERFSDGQSEEGGGETWDNYLQSFHHPFEFSRQFSILKAGTLVGVAHMDLTAISLSAIYCYYDDALKRESLGTYAILRQIQLAREQAVDYVYLGYYIPENKHMSYKARYVPSEVLLEEGVWAPFLDSDGKRRPGLGAELRFTAKKSFVP